MRSGAITFLILSGIILLSNASTNPHLSRAVTRGLSSNEKKRAPTLPVVEAFDDVTQLVSKGWAVVSKFCKSWIDLLFISDV